MKKKLIIALFFVLASVVIYAAGTTLRTFSAKTSGTDIIVEWTSVQEVNLKEFQIERKSDQSSFVYVTTEEAQGDNSRYSYVDDKAFMSKDNNGDQVLKGKEYFYRLKFVGEDGSVSYSDPVPVTQHINSVQRTWGMIKEMFR
jgi:hypothetical protein